MGGRIHENLSHENFFTSIIKSTKVTYAEANNTCATVYIEIFKKSIAGLPLSKFLHRDTPAKGDIILI